MIALSQRRPRMATQLESCDAQHHWPDRSHERGFLAGPAGLCKADFGAGAGETNAPGVWVRKLHAASWLPGGGGRTAPSLQGASPPGRVRQLPHHDRNKDEGVFTKSCRIWLHALCLAVRNWHLACALAPAELSFVKEMDRSSNKKRMSALLSHIWSARKRKCRRSSRSSPPRKCSLSRVAQQPTARLVRPFLC